MARTKSTPHRSPGFLYEAARDIPRLLSRHATTPARQQQLLRVADLNELPIPTDWISERLKAHKPKHQRELEKAYGIITAALNDPASVAVKDLQWAKEIAEKEKELEEAENETLSADSEGNVYGDRDGEYLPLYCCGYTLISIEEDLPPARPSAPTQTSTSALLTAANLASLAHENDDKSISALSTISNVSDLAPQASPAKASDPPSSLIIAEEEDDTPAPTNEVSRTRARLSHALNTLEYNDTPPDRPPWLTDLPKPLPHPDLTALENFEVETRVWSDELERLTRLRAGLPVPSSSSSDGNDNVEGAGEWHYASFRGTEEVVKIVGKKRDVVFARGVWTFLVDGEVRSSILDEFPLSGEGELLGWGAWREEGAEVVAGVEGRFVVKERGVESEIGDDEGVGEDDEGEEGGVGGMDEPVESQGVEGQAMELDITGAEEGEVVVWDDENMADPEWEDVDDESAEDEQMADAPAVSDEDEWEDMED
tara:strand:+ start:15755 stop:17206 length:1452 start_codon:yes stop_codon:yes gene_type:complete